MERSSARTARDGFEPTYQTILLVEDEETLRLAVSMSLKKHGFSVLAAADGRTAITLFREHAQRIDTTLLDLTLPGVSGVDVFHELLRIRGDAKIILTSAYDRERISSRLVSEAFAFIRKPYRLSELVAALGGMVEESEARSNYIFGNSAQGISSDASMPSD